MWNFFFKIDQMALWLVLGAICAAYILKKIFFTSQTPHLSFSFLRGLHLEKSSGRPAWAFLPERLLQVSLLFFTLAFLDPYLLVDKKKSPFGQDQPEKMPPSTEGIAIYLVLDQSGSMAEKLMTTGPNEKENSFAK